MSDPNATSPTPPRSYDATYTRWQADPDAFWAEAAGKLHWERPWDRVCDFDAPPFVKWFPGALTNTCWNALDRHVAGGRGDQVALIHDSPVTGRIGTDATRLTYRELLERVARFAGCLRDLGVGRGDRVLIYMPMIPEAVVAMLACARLGAVHSVVFGGFAPKELATRIDDAQPVAIVTATCGIEVQKVIPYLPLLRKALAIAEHAPPHLIVKQRPEWREAANEERASDWDDLMDAEPAPATCVWVESTDPLYILYTSGTTGVPKGVVRDHGGHQVALDWSMRHVYGTEPGATYWAASDIGWVVGHSYIVYAPLIHGCTSVLFEGKPVGTPDAKAFWRVIADHGVDVLFTAPTAVRAIKREDPQGHGADEFDLSSLKTLFLAGERADPDTLQWAEALLGVPVVDHWWQTETGWPIVANCVGLDPLPVKHGSPTKPVPGYRVRVVDPDGLNLPAGEIGSIIIDLPLPPGCLTTLWHNEDGFIDSYMSEFPGSYATGDAGYLDDDGYLYVMSRTDDLINVAGHRLSTGAMEEVLASHPDVAEAAVLGVRDELKGEVPVGLVVLNAGTDRMPEQIMAELVGAVRKEIGPVASFKQAIIVPRLPKTRSGKVLRKTMRALANGDEFGVPATIDDPHILEEVRERLKTIGYPRRGAQAETETDR